MQTVIASLKIAGTSSAISAGFSAVGHTISTGSLNGIGKSALNGAADGFMWGGIVAGAVNLKLAAKATHINKIGRLKPSNKPGNGYMGVRYGTRRSNGKYSYKSIELHSPHKGGPHQMWHWQRNKWSYRDDIWKVSSKAKRWNIWGRRI